MPDWINPVIDEKSVANVLPLAMSPAILLRMAVLRNQRSQCHVFEAENSRNTKGLSTPENRDIQKQRYSTVFVCQRIRPYRESRCASRDRILLNIGC
jgi:hypothetical protein